MTVLLAQHLQHHKAHQGTTFLGDLQFQVPLTALQFFTIAGHLNLSSREPHLFLAVKVKQVLGPSRPGDCKVRLKLASPKIET
jgi:hypothetical protein